MKAWSEMKPRERDAAIAERVMGRTVTHNRFAVPGQEPTIVGWDTSSVAGGTTRLSIPHYTTDHAAARLVEDEIERRGYKEYINHFIDIVDPKTGTRADEVFTTFDSLWVFVRATPDQRCEAAWRACGGADE